MSKQATEDKEEKIKIIFERNEYHDKAINEVFALNDAFHIYA